jgi:hypothetical protein
LVVDRLFVGGWLRLANAEEFGGFGAEELGDLPIEAVFEKVAPNVPLALLEQFLALSESASRRFDSL